MHEYDKETLVARIVGKNIRKYRDLKYLTQDDLSEYTYLSRTYISEIENGKKNITVVRLLEISEALDVDFEALVEGINDY